MFLSYIKAGRTKTASFLFTSLILCCGVFTSQTTAHAASLEEIEQEQEAQKAIPVESNEIDNWPVGPVTSAQSAILMDVDTGSILYAKDINRKSFPASTTKILTCLVAMEQGNLDDSVSFSNEAVFSVPADGSNMGMDVGEEITLEQCLYGILVGSANEAANAVGEHIAGSIDGFVDMMNERAAELGCTNSHFMNTNGLHDENHYTSAHDLALIAAAFFRNDMLCKIGNTARYEFTATPTQPDDFILLNKHKMITGEAAYDGVLGGKTGYTDDSRQTLVTCAERNGMRLVCVVFREETPNQFTDTMELFDYGFNNFQIMNIAENEKKYQIEPSGFLQTGNDIFGSSKPILSIDDKSRVIVPNTITFDDLESTIDYQVSDGNRIAQIQYSYHGINVGNAYLELAADNSSTYEFDTNPDSDNIDAAQTETPGQRKESAQADTIFINVKTVLICVLVIAAALILLFVLRALAINNRNARRRQNRVKRKQRRRERIRSELDDFDF